MLSFIYLVEILAINILNNCFANVYAQGLKIVLQFIDRFGCLCLSLKVQGRVCCAHE